MSKSKRLIKIETGVWVDPDHVVAIYPFAIGTDGWAKIVLDTGETIQCQWHEAILPGTADAEVVEELMRQVIDDMIDPMLMSLDGSYKS